MTRATKIVQNILGGNRKINIDSISKNEKEPSYEDEDTTDYFLGPDPRKHKDYKRLLKKE